MNRDIRKSTNLLRKRYNSARRNQQTQEEEEEEVKEAVLPASLYYSDKKQCSFVNIKILPELH